MGSIARANWCVVFSAAPLPRSASARSRRRARSGGQSDEDVPPARGICRLPAPPTALWWVGMPADSAREKSPLMIAAYRGLAWAHGVLAVQRLGAMLAPVTFILADGRQVSPLHVAPWAGEPGTESLPGILRRLRGEWPCVPFGYSVPADGFVAEWAKSIVPGSPDEEVHGHCSNNDWRFDDAPEGSLRLSIDYPGTSPVKRVERTITPDPAGPAVDLTFRIEVREDCRLPLGLHPVLRLPLKAGGAR